MGLTNTQLLELIRALNVQERQEMALFLASPMFNQGRNALENAKLFQVIVGTAPDFSSNLLQKELIYFQVFKDKHLVPGKLEKLMTELTQLLRVFVVTRRFLDEQNETKRQVEWAAWLREKNLADRSIKVLEKLKNISAENRKESLHQYRMDLLIAEEKHIWESTQNQAQGDLDIAQVICQLDVYYHNYRTELQNRYLLQKKVAQLPELEDYMEHVHAAYQQSILFQVSENIFNVLEKGLPTIEETQQLVAFLQENSEALSKETLEHLYTYMRNFYTLLINAGNVEYLAVLHNLNQDNLERGFFLVNGKISHHAYLNIAVVAIRMKAFDWAKKITEEYKDLILNGDENGLYYKLNTVYRLFAEGLFEEALDFLPDPPLSSIYHQKFRRLELQLYYELRSELLEYKIDAFRKYLERTATKSLSANLREMNVNFLNLILQLTQSPPKSKARAEQLMKRIQNKKLLAERAWLLEKAKELA